MGVWEDLGKSVLQGVVKGIDDYQKQKSLHEISTAADVRFNLRRKTVTSTPFATLQSNIISRAIINRRLSGDARAQPSTMRRAFICWAKLPLHGKISSLPKIFGRGTST